MALANAVGLLPDLGIALNEVHDVAGRRAEQLGRIRHAPRTRLEHVHDEAHDVPVCPALGRWIQSLKSVLGKEIAAAGNPRPHWQEGFFDHLMRGQESYAEKWAYVRDNPVRSGLCGQAGEWPYQGEIVSIPW